MNDYGLYNCWGCLCEVCTRIGCPKAHRRTKLGFCLAMLQREACPTVKCDWFVHKQKHKVYRILRRHKHKDVVIGKLDKIIERLDRENKN